MKMILEDADIAYNIANELKKEFKAGDILTKGGIRAKYCLSWVRSSCVFKELTLKHGFIEVDIRHLQVPESKEPA